MIIVGIFILIWYCDNVFPNRGNSASPLFFLSNKYWRCLSQRRRKISFQKDVGKSPTKFSYDNLQPHDTVNTEKDRVLDNLVAGRNCKGVRITRLGKTYHKYPFGIKSRNDMEALKDVYLEIDEGELLTILGPNGAGKTTFFGVLTGLFEPSTGTAEIYNYDIRFDLDDVPF